MNDLPEPTARPGSAPVPEARGTILLTGATGFVGRYAHDALVRAGWSVRCATRNVAEARRRWPERSWVRMQVGDPLSVREALTGCRAALYMIHGMASHGSDFREAEIHQARTFADAAAAAGLERIVYLGGVAAPRDASEHLRSREEVGETLRAGSVLTVELRASMIVGHGSLSWLMVRDLAARLPVMILPRWLASRTEPVSIADVVSALAGALELELEESAWFDIPGPELLSGREILERTADALGVRRAGMIEVPFLTPRLSSHWVRFVTRAEWSVAREVVVGLKTDLIAEDDGFWKRIGQGSRMSFDDAARAALADERHDPPLQGFWGFVERQLVRFGRIRSDRGRAHGPAPSAAGTNRQAGALALLWAVGAYASTYVGLWAAMGTTAVVLGIAAWALEGRRLLGRGPHRRLVPIGIVAGLAMAGATVALYDPVTRLVPALGSDVDQLYHAFRATGTLASILLIPAVVAFEELIWRGAVYSALADRLPWVGAALAASLLYALAHVPAGSPALVLASLGAGLCWNLLRARTGSLVPAYAAHIVWNYSVLVFYQLA
jgi:uncharacterized protein YbjT (DUF2867 family)/membrane protease YdiL (CAAX protease family)